MKFDRRKMRDVKQSCTGKVHRNCHHANLISNPIWYKRFTLLKVVKVLLDNLSGHLTSNTLQLEMR